MTLALTFGLLMIVSRPIHFVATADSVAGITAKGTTTHEGIVAADPSVLPLGSIIRISRAGPWSGTYLVTDTGAKIVGRRIDIYMTSHAEAKHFGRKQVLVQIVSKGNNRRDHRETAPPPA